MDAKVATADMASRMMVWAAFGKPNQREWVRRREPATTKNDGLYPSGYYLFSAEPSEGCAPRFSRTRQAAARAAKVGNRSANRRQPRRASLKDRLWKGWVLPASDADTWFVAGSAAYYYGFCNRTMWRRR